MGTITEPGIYKAKAIGWGLEKAKEKGTMGVAIEFSIRAPEHPEVDGAKAWATLWMPLDAEKREALTRSIDTLRHLGWNGADTDDLDNGKADLTKGEVELDVQPDTYNGQTKLKVKWVNIPGHRAKPVVAVDDKAAFKAAFKARMATLGNGASETPF